MVVQGAPTEKPVDDATMALALRLAELIVSRSRAEGTFNLESFLLAGEREMGGSLVIENPSKKRRRARVEIRYASEGFQLASGIAAIGFED